MPKPPWPQHLLDAVPVQLVTRLERIAVDGFHQVLVSCRGRFRRVSMDSAEAGRRLKLAPTTMPQRPEGRPPQPPQNAARGPLPSGNLRVLRKQPADGLRRAR